MDNERKNDLNEETVKETAEDAAKETEGSAPAEDKKAAKKAAKKKKDEEKKHTVWDEVANWIALLVLAVVLAGLFRGLVAEPIRVDGKSMLNTLQDGEVVLVTKPALLRGDLRRGDVVICHYPGRVEKTLRIGATMTMDISTAFVKRLIALPGDAVAILNGQLYVNDAPVTEDYIDFPPTYDMERRVMREDEYFVMGDNRANSHDSRSPEVGPIHEKMIVGHAKWVILPLNRIRAIH